MSAIHNTTTYHWALTDTPSPRQLPPLPDAGGYVSAEVLGYLWDQIYSDDCPAQTANCIKRLAVNVRSSVIATFLLWQHIARRQLPAPDATPLFISLLRTALPTARDLSTLFQEPAIEEAICVLPQLMSYLLPWRALRLVVPLRDRLLNGLDTLPEDHG